MSRIKFIYFDVGEVLVKGARTKHVATFLGMPYEDVRSVFKKYQHDTLIGKMTTEEFFEKLKKELSLNTQEKDFAKLLVDNLEPIREVHDFFHTIKKTHKVGYLTNLYAGIFHKMKEKKIIPHAEDAILVGSWEVGFAKPESKMFAIAQEKAGVAPQEILLIDDNAENVEAAKQLGWQAILFDVENPKTSLDLVKQLL